MPEIPDLNIFVKNLAKRLVGKKLQKFDILIERQLKRPKAEFSKVFEGHKIVYVKRIGKELRFGFEGGGVLGLHLMLHGTMYWFDKKNEERFTIAEMHFEDGLGLAITDWQKAVILTLDPVESKVPDALALPANYLKTQLEKTSRVIKTVLTDGKTVQGIGNAYVDEILYKAKISPFSKADKLPAAAVKKLTNAIGSVLKDAEDHIEKNFPDTISEKERDFLQVHRPKKTETLKGEEILKAEIDKRKTYYIAEQQLFE